jgi:hypothetical protein
MVAATTRHVVMLATRLRQGGRTSKKKTFFYSKTFVYSKTFFSTSNFLRAGNGTAAILS